ncbi:hypothetical protein V8C34DRAFT_267632 [Trichoderma compactum]
MFSIPRKESWLSVETWMALMVMGSVLGGVPLPAVRPADKRPKPHPPVVQKRWARLFRLFPHAVDSFICPAEEGNLHRRPVSGPGWLA